MPENASDRCERASARLLRWVSAAAVLVASACAPLEPVTLPDEFTPEPAHATLPDSESDWHVLLNRGPEALDWRLRAIDSATDSIDLQTFLWEFDTAGALVLDHVLAAADRGVYVRILVDDSYLAGDDAPLLALDSHPNVSYRIFNPFQRRVDNVITRQLLNAAEFHRLDHRMHNKAMVVDRRVAIVGGRNLADEYFGLHGSANFRDLELIVGGPIVRAVAQEFDDYWNDDWSFPIDRISHAEASREQLEQAARLRDEHTYVHVEERAAERRARWIELRERGRPGRTTLFADRPPEGNPANPDEAPVQVADELIALFDEAEEEIVIVSAYLIPSPELEGAVARAVDRGVRVRILTNSIRSNNHLVAHAAYRNHVETLLESGAELHEVRVDARDRHVYMLTPVGERILALHAKAFAFDDDQVFIGSMNLDPRSLRINTEMGLLVESEALNAEVRAAIDRDFDQANAWELRFDEDGQVLWVSGETVLRVQPAQSLGQRIADWFFRHLPIEGEL